MDSFPVWAWVSFGALLIILLAIDLFVHREGTVSSTKRALGWSVVWVVAGLGFGGFIALNFGQEPAKEYLAAYLIEKSLSIDNLFVFLVIFQSLKIPHDQQRQVLLWGILGALFFRAIFVFLGSEALANWEWLTFIFAAFLLGVAWKVLRSTPQPHRESKVAQWLAKHLPFTPELHGNHFLVRLNGKLMATPLLVALLSVEVSDILFAVDSVPAALSVTRETFLIYSSNAFAILGLRALYIVIVEALGHLAYLHYGLSAILAFAGIKLALSHWVEIPAGLSIGFILTALGASAFFSRGKKRKTARDSFVSDDSKVA